MTNLRCRTFLASFLFLVQYCLVWTATVALADDISLTIDITAQNDQVTIRAVNTNRDTAENLSLTLALAGESYSPIVATSLKSGESFTTTVHVTLPPLPGSYPLLTTVAYDNDSTRLSLLNVGYFNVGQSRILPGECSLPEISLRQSKVIELPFHANSDTKYGDRLVLPNELVVTPGGGAPSGFARFRIENPTPLFNGRTSYYLLTEREENGVHFTRICTGALSTHRVIKASSRFGAVGFGTAALLALVVLLILMRRLAPEAELSLSQIALRRWLFSIFTVGGLLFLFHTLSAVPEYLLGELHFDQKVRNVFGPYFEKVVRSLIGWLYFDGGNYDYFAQYVHDWLFLYMLVGNFLVLRYLIRPSAATDKYWHLLVAIPGLAGRSYVGWTGPARIAVLTLMVKSFYVPMLSSWAINNVFHQIHLSHSFSWSFVKVNEYLVATCILVDVAFFAVGYLTELPQLKNQIRSVEPTLLGWVVCLMCYPPFNDFALTLADRPLNENWRGLAGETGAHVATVSITLLWVVYTAATVALGLRSSNLTNRGIVAKGPYRFIRHPAYVSKVTLWILSSMFLGEKNFYLILALITVYALRAWTEERHLSCDPEYLAYKKRVPYVLIPGVI